MFHNNYIKFIKKFKDSGYKFISFDENIKSKYNIILRHDIDFDVDHALKMAQIENNLNIKSTYFFLQKTNFYNILNPHIIKKIKKIKKLGHSISLHFDPSIYKNNEMNRYLKEEIKLFENIYMTKIKIISFHRPPIKFINLKNKILGKNHTYQPLFTKKIKYYSDSRNKFRFGNPVMSIDFKLRNSMQILIHPIWWINLFNNSTQFKINKFIIKKKNDLIEDLKISLGNADINFLGNARKNRKKT